MSTHPYSDDDIFIVQNPDGPLKGLSKDQFIQKVKTILENKKIVKEAYIFGSFNSDEFHANSDVDIAIVAETDKKFFDRHQDFVELYDLVEELDILIYTPSEAHELKLKKNSFWQNVFERSLKIDYMPSALLSSTVTEK